MHHPTDRIAHTMTFVTPVVEHWLEREIAQSAISIKISNLIIGFCSFDFSRPILKKDNFIEILYIVLSGLIK